MLQFYDFEVFKHDWMVVIIDPVQQTTITIHNDSEALKQYYEAHSSDIWVGYNNKHYDQYIYKGILLGMNPKGINDKIIVQGVDGWQISREFNKINMINYDVMNKLDGGLKSLEGFMGNDIKETEVHFDIDRPLTKEEIEQTIFYCTHDVEQTIEVFMERKNDFDATMGLISTFNLPISSISKTHAQLSAEILKCSKKSRDDEFSYPLVDTLRLKKYKHVQEWFENAPNDCDIEMYEKFAECENDSEAWKKAFYKRNLKINVCGVPHVFGWGGLHGAPKEPIHRKGLILHVDVNSYYPSIMIRYNMLTRNSLTPEKFKEIYDYRLALKAAGKKKEQAPYKIVLNGTYGISKDKYSQAYDPMMANAVCVNGQLMLLDLLEHLEGHCELIQSNTDGLIIMIPDTDDAFYKIDDVCYEWEQRTGMGLGLDVIKEIYQKDVNNYVWIDEDGNIERKGSYVQELSQLKYDLPIVNKAMVDYMTKHVPVEYTILECNDLKEFQKIVKLSRKYLRAWHNGSFTVDKCHRVFASKDNADSYIGKQKADGVTIEKFANTPEHCFIENGSMQGTNCPAKLDKQWYINLAKKRLKDFGIKEVLDYIGVKSE